VQQHHFWSTSLALAPDHFGSFWQLPIFSDMILELRKKYKKTYEPFCHVTGKSRTIGYSPVSPPIMEPQSEAASALAAARARAERARRSLGPALDAAAGLGPVRGIMKHHHPQTHFCG
jgi:hypothetical protein